MAVDGSEVWRGPCASIIVFADLQSVEQMYTCMVDVAIIGRPEGRSAERYSHGGN
jgi:hypothetical protein